LKAEIKKTANAKPAKRKAKADRWKPGISAFSFSPFAFCLLISAFSFPNFYFSFSISAL
jgi:hypothetical protein